MEPVSLSQARAKIGEMINQAAYGNKRVIIAKHGRDIAAVISIRDLQLFEELEDRLLGIEADRRLGNEKPLPYRGTRRK